MHPQLINMDLQEGIIIKGIYTYTYTSQNIYTRSSKCKLKIIILYDNNTSVDVKSLNM